MPLKRFSIVPVDSSAARMPLPRPTMPVATFASSLMTGLLSERTAEGCGKREFYRGAARRHAPIPGHAPAPLARQEVAEHSVVGEPVDGKVFGVDRDDLAHPAPLGECEQGQVGEVRSESGRAHLSNPSTPTSPIS